MNTILIVEDSPSFAALLQKRIAESLSLDVVLARSFRETRACLHADPHRFFLAILDLNLPDAPDGEIVDYILQQKIPGIVLTGTFKKEFQDRMLEKGILDYFVKDNVGVIDSVIHAVDRILKNKNINILIVDDSRSVRRAVGSFLARYGFNVLEAADGLLAMEVIEQQPIHLVVTDYQMPRMDGIRLMKKLRTRFSRDELAAIGLSSIGDRELAVQFIKAGANDFLVKPFQPEELLCRVYQNIETIERHRDLGALLERHRSVLTHALDAIITLDENGLVLDYNPAAEILFGYAKETILNRNVIDFIIPESVRHRHLSGLAGWVESGRNPAELRRRFEIHGQRADGKIIDLQVSLTGVMQNGKPQFTAFLQDITDRKQLLKSLEETLAVAESANRSKSEFIANMSHEFRTPMNAILGFTDLALKSDLSVKVRGYLEKIENASRTLMGVINDILDFSKIDAGRMELDPVPFDLHQLLDRMADLFSKQVADRGIELVILAPLAFNQVLLGDVLRLEQILINLIRNAVKFTEQGSITIRVQVQNAPNGRFRLDFAVQDTGIGIEADKLPKLFAPFVQADGSTTRKYGGTGLGLSICNRLVNLMDGQIQVESLFGQGSVFSFHVLVDYFSENRREPPTLPDELKGRKVLLVDDNLAFCEQFSALLALLELETTVVNSVGDALADVVTHSKYKDPFDFVFIDWHMPEHDGMALVVEIHSRLAAEKLPEKPPRIILLTPFGNDSIRAQGERVGVDGFLDKPVTRQPLLRTILTDVPGKADVIDRRLKYNLAAEKTTAEKIGGARILLVEESDINQQVHRELLERVGLVVEVARDGREALDKLEHYLFDALLMDVRLPVMDGYDVARTIRSREYGKDFPIMAMAMQTLPDEHDKCQAAGVNALLEKPIRPERLYGMLTKWIVRIQQESHEDDLHIVPGLIPRLAGLDTRLGMKRIAGNQALYGQLLRRFVIEHGQCGEEISRTLAAGTNLDLARKKLHALKGLAKNIGAIPLFRAADALEENLAGTADPVARQANLTLFNNKLYALVSGLKEKLLHEPPSATPIQFAALPEIQVDKAATAPLLLALAGHLACHSVQITDLLTGLDAILEPTEAENVWHELRKQIQDYNFKEALDVLQRIAHSLNIEIPDTWPTPAHSGRERVLIVDDLRSNVDILKEILVDYDCFVALDGEQTLRIAQMEIPPNIILLDIMMPDMNGYEVCQRIKENPLQRNIPVIFVTARREVSDQTEGFRVGGVDYIIKPFNAEIIQHRVKTHLELKRHRDQLEQQVRERTRELQEAQQEAERRKAAAEAGNLAKSRFLATMSHEIRTPMNAILGMAEALQETELTQEQKQYVAVFRRSGHGLMRLINDVLDLSKVEAGRLDLAFEPFDLHETLDALHKMIEPRALAKGLVFTREVDPAILPWVMGDAHRIYQVILNLLDNAVKFTQSGSVKLRVGPDPAKPGFVQIMVEDSGIGIPLEKQEEIFQGFSQADTSITRRFGGSGLGLAICKRLISLMGGVMAVESAPDRGSIFHFSVPMPPAANSESGLIPGLGSPIMNPETNPLSTWQPPAAPMSNSGNCHLFNPVPPVPATQSSATQHPEAQSPVTQHPETQAKATILLAEDAEDNQLLIGIYLRKSPYRLVIAANGKEALERCRRDSFDLVLMDVQMPVMDGYTATRHIRQHELEEGKIPIPIIALTAHAFEDETHRASEAGCSGFLTKPVSKKRLLDAIATAIQERQQNLPTT
ncbi:MAG: response regulator [Magnetococcales bacterium]|nr:response regulator [Magnetococcales bacterium]